MIRYIFLPTKYKSTTNATTTIKKWDVLPFTYLEKKRRMES